MIALISLSVLVPFYKSDVIETLIDQIEKSLSGFYDYEILIIDDRSQGNYWNILQKISREKSKVRCFELARNFGQHSALLAGIHLAKNELIVTLDDDLQNPPEEIPVLVKALVERDLDLIYGIPEKIEQNFFRRMLSKSIRFFLKYILRIEQAELIGSFRVFRTNLTEYFPKNTRGNVSIDALLFWCTENIGAKKVKHDQRQVGTSNYSFKKLLKFAFDTITGYSTIPLKLATYMGLFASMLGLGVLAYLFIRYAIYGGQVAGFTFTSSLITIFAGVQLFSLGIIGEYLARVHTKIMEKPSYVIRRSI